MFQRLSFFIFISILISSCSDGNGFTQERIDKIRAMQVANYPKTDKEIKQEKFDELIDLYYPNFTKYDHALSYDSSATNYTFISYKESRDSITGEIVQRIDGPLIAFYENGNPELLQFQINHDYAGIEYWFDSLGVLETRKVRMQKPLGDEGKIWFFQDYFENDEGIKQCWFVEIENNIDTIKVFSEKEFTDVQLKVKACCDDCDSLGISYFIPEQMEDYQFLMKIGINDSIFTVPNMLKGYSGVNFSFGGYFIGGEGKKRKGLVRTKVLITLENE